MNDHTDRTTGLPAETRVVSRTTLPRQSDAIQDTGVVIATRSHDLIREWARRHSAEPATGKATSSGPATVDVQDGGASIRFNFPAAAAFRPIDWNEWFAVFEAEDLVFAYEPEDAAGGTFGRQASSYYRLMPAQAWAGTLR
jgi:hypothetical protein